MSESREGNLLRQKIVEIQSSFTPQEMSLFSDLKNRCLQRNGEFYLDKKFFPFPEEQEDFFQFLLKMGILQKLGRSENGVGGFVWKLETSKFDELRSLMLGQETEETSDRISAHELAVDALFENLDYNEMDYLLRIPELWMIEGTFSQLDIQENLPGDILSVHQKRTIFQGLINVGIAERSANPNIILISRVQYFALWSKLFHIDKTSSPEQFEGLEQNEGIIFQSLSCFFETYVGHQSVGKITKEYFPEFMKIQLKNKYHWNIKKENFFVLLLENLIERGFFLQYNVPAFGDVVELTPQGYRYLGKTVPEGVLQKYLLLEQAQQKKQEAEEQARRLEEKELRRRLFLEQSSQEYSPGFRVDTPFMTSQEFIPVEKPRRRVISEPEKRKRIVPVFDQHKNALEKMLRKETQEGVRELYAHQTPMVDDFLEYLKKVVEVRELSKESTDEELQEREKIDMTYARIVSAPRTGKTTVAADIIRRTGLMSVFFVPSINLVAQAKVDLEALLPGKKIAMYSGEYLEDISEADVIVATYQKGVMDLKKGQELPKEISSAPLVFADEGHEATTKSRMDLLSECNTDALKIALSGTPDYNEERILERYFPTLIHELSMREAIEMGILAPFRYSTYVVGIDASRVKVKVGEYDEAQIGAIMSELPFFKFCEALRYSNTNKNTPALLVCKTKAQAFALEKYLNQTRGENSGGIGVVVDKTDNRDKILEQYEQGKINTLITVRALLRGWDSPRCKLLIDMAPGRSPVLAGQKYTRPLTKNAEEEATLYTLLPMNLPLEPMLPSDVLMSYEMDLSGVPVGKQYDAGRGGTSKVEEQSDLLPDTIDGVSIKLKVRNREYGSFGSMKFDSDNEDLIHEVIESGLQFEEGEENTEQIRNKKRVEILKSYFAFRNTLFSHEKFQGYGRTFLFLCGVKGFDEYWDFVMKLFPEEAGTLFMYGQRLNMDLDRGLNHQLNLERPIASDIEKIVSAIPERRYDSEEIGTLVKVFFGYDGIRDFDDIFLRKKVQEVLLSLTEREQDILRRRFVEGKMLEEVGLYHDLNKERIRQIEASALRKMRKLLKTRDIEDFMDEKFNRSKKPS